MTSDLDLLGQFAREKSQDAFTALVNRHVNLVHSAALRQVRSPQLAEEVAQSVFADLARNAGKFSGTGVPPVNSLTPWLYAVTRRTAIDVVRKESRRQLREQIAVEMDAMNAQNQLPYFAKYGNESAWPDIEPLLDDAMAALDETDRSAILLRYFENKNLREVGEELKISDDAAQKRVSRAVERLREFFAKRGVSVGAGGLAVVISANAIQAAPIGLAATISAAAVLAGTAVHTSTFIAATKTIAMTTLQKTLVAATVAVLAGAGIYEARQATQLREQNQTLQQQQVPLAEQLLQLQSELNASSNRVIGLGDELARANKNNSELLQLRGQLGILKSQADKFKEERNNYQKQAALISGQEILPQKDVFTFHSFVALTMAREVALAMRVYDTMNKEFPTNFNQELSDYYKRHIAKDLIVGRNGLDAFEVMPNGNLAGLHGDTKNVILIRERTSRQRPDGQWERIYAFTDGTAQPVVSESGDFSDWESQHLSVAK